MPINAPTPSAPQLALIAMLAAGLVFAASRVAPKLGRGDAEPVRFAWGYVTETNAPDGGTRLLAHVTAPPEDGVIALDIPLEAVRSCVARTEPCAPLAFERFGARGLKIPLPKTLGEKVTVIEVDLAAAP